MLVIYMIFTITICVGMCPKGDDPITSFTDYRSIIIRVNQYYIRPSSGSYKFSFNGQSISLPISQWSDQQCQEAFQKLPNVLTVKCGVNRNGRYGGYSMLIQFIAFPVIPFENNIYTHNGNPPISSFFCDSTAITSSGAVSCTITDVATNTLPGESNFSYD
jgi:hypothetical protein